MTPDLLFAAYKPAGMSSNTFLGRLKRKYGTKKMGYSGTLDPFAKGVLVIGAGRYTTLFRFLSKTPKRYRAVLWLGAQSPTLDIEGVRTVTPVAPLDDAAIRRALTAMTGPQMQMPPAYSAKKIDGRRAYDLARRGEDVVLQAVPINVHATRLIHYRHPFVTFEATVSEGTYIRVLGLDLARALGCDGALSSLERLGEGTFVRADETPLEPTDYIDLTINRYCGDADDIRLGKKLSIERFEKREPGVYMVQYPEFFSIIEMTASGVVYLANAIPRYHHGDCTCSS